MQTYRNLKTPNKGVFRFLQYNDLAYDEEIRL